MKRLIHAVLLLALVPATAGDPGGERTLTALRPA